MQIQKENQKKREKMTSVLCNILQKSTVTAANRHAHLIQIIHQKFVIRESLTSPFNVLSYGCSSGQEIANLLKEFPFASNITGVDIDQVALKQAKDLHESNKALVTILESSEFAQLKDYTCDFITCFNVLCHFFSGQSPTNAPIAFSVFEKSVQELVQFLKPGGLLCVYGANYSVNDVALPLHIQRLEILIDNGPVPMFKPNGTTLIPRSNKNIFLLQNSLLPCILNTVSHTEEKVSEPFIVTQTFGINGMIPVACNNITFGLLRPGIQSSNLGDYMQTLAQVNVLSHFYNPNTWRCSPVMHMLLQEFARSKPSGFGVRQQQHPSQVTLTWFDRDSSSKEIADNNIVYVIANGWYMHKDIESQQFNFPFASHFRPIFVSVHMAHPEILDQVGVCDYLRKYQPIGCRDRATRDLMRSKNIDAYFSSCLTTTLECAFSGNSDEQDEDLTIDTFDASISHTFETKNPDELLHTAFLRLRRYCNTNRIRSTRIHCLLPTRACSTKPELIFCSRSGGQDESWMSRSRFSGLVDVMEDAQSREMFATALYEQLIDRVHNILFGIATKKCCNEVCDISRQKELSVAPNLIRAMHPSSIICSATSNIAAILRETEVQTVHETRCATWNSQFRHNREFVLRKSPFKPFENQMDILVTFDSAYVSVLPVFLQHLSTSNAKTLFRVWCGTRNIAIFSTLPVVPKCPPNIILFHVPLDNYVKFANYASPLKHVSEVCLDRVLVEKIDFGTRDVNRIIYLDLDIAVIGNLVPLLHLDSGTKGVIAKTSIIQNVMNSWLNKYDLLDSTQKIHAPRYTFSKSFNAGVMVIDLDKIRKNKMYDFCTSLYSKFGLNDQILLNFYCQGQYKELPPRYNIFVGQDDKNFTPLQDLPDSATAYHFVGSHKPWLNITASTYSVPWLFDLWFKFETAKNNKHKHIAG